METETEIVRGWCAKQGIRVEIALKAIFHLAKKFHICPTRMEHIFAVSITTGSTLADGLDAFFSERIAA